MQVILIWLRSRKLQRKSQKTFCQTFTLNPEWCSFNLRSNVLFIIYKLLIEIIRKEKQYLADFSRNCMSSWKVSLPEYIRHQMFHKYSCKQWNKGTCEWIPFFALSDLIKRPKSRSLQMAQRKLWRETRFPISKLTKAHQSKGLYFLRNLTNQAVVGSVGKNIINHSRYLLTSGFESYSQIIKTAKDNDNDWNKVISQSLISTWLGCIKIWGLLSYNKRN